MAQKLTEAEQSAVGNLSKSLARALAPSDRDRASSIASALVRLRLDPIPEGTLRQTLEKHGLGDRTIEALAQNGIIVAAAEGSWSIAQKACGSDRTAGGKHDRSASGPSGAEGRAKPSQEPKGGEAAGRTTGKSLAKTGERGVVRKQTPELTEIRMSIIELDPRLWINGFLLSTPSVYERYRKELEALSAALDGNASIGDGALTVRELSYRIFGDEKFLAIESPGRKLLRQLGVADLLRCSHPAQPELLHFIPKRRSELTLVMSENLDPWTHMRDALFLQGRKRLLDVRVHGVVFGNGHLATGARQIFDLVDTLGAEEVRILYWGDIDRAGLEILAKLDALVRDHALGNGGEEERPTPAIELLPFREAYRLMIKRAMKRYPDPRDNRATDQVNVPITGIELMEDVLEPAELDYLEAVLDSARLIPQEIVVAGDL